MASLVGLAMRQAGDGRLDVPVAVMMGLAGGALVFMMPISILEGAALSSGLANVFPPAYPPLGLTAQAVSGVVAALIGFSVAFAVMRFIDRAPGMFDPKERADDEAEEEPALRMRRRDLHPDAPVRRPLSAARDLGDPFERQPEPVIEAPRRRKPLAAMLEPEETALPHMPWERDPAPAADVPQKKRVRAPLAAEPEESAAEVPVIETPTPPEPVEEHAEEVVAQEPLAPPVLEVAEDEPASGAGFDWEERAFVASEEAATPEPEAPRVSARSEETVGELLARFERALDRRQNPVPLRRPQPAEVPAPVAQPADPIDTRLRSALDNLRRFAPQRG